MHHVSGKKNSKICFLFTPGHTATSWLQEPEKSLCDQPIFLFTKQVGHGNQIMVSVTETDMIDWNFEVSHMNRKWGSVTGHGDQKLGHMTRSR